MHQEITNTVRRTPLCPLTLTCMDGLALQFPVGLERYWQKVQGREKSEFRMVFIPQALSHLCMSCSFSWHALPSHLSSLFSDATYSVNPSMTFSTVSPHYTLPMLKTREVELLAHCHTAKTGGS